MKVFVWQNCYADVGTVKHSIALKSYLSDVINPTIEAVKNQIAKYAASDEGGAPFAQSDAEYLLDETIMAFCLAIQSFWERQIREYLIGCAGELRPKQGLEDKVKKATWEKLEGLFFDLRGISLKEFPSYETLFTLHLLGNVSRHGEGPSVEKLWRRRPDFWPRDRFAMPGQQKPTGPPSVGQMNISPVELRSFINAIISFWDDAEYIYLESIDRKHESVERKLALLRNERSWVPKGKK